MMTLADTIPEAQDTVVLHFVGLPVRAAVSSGIQTEEVIREIQLDQGLAGGPVRGDVNAFFALVDRSAPVRLAGRHAALRAAAQGHERFDLVLETSSDSLVALPLLAKSLEQFEADRHAPLPVLTDDVLAFREWLQAETVRQRSGRGPTPCPLAHG
jgi:hypothetical protein